MPVTLRWSRRALIWIGIALLGSVHGSLGVAAGVTATVKPSQPAIASAHPLATNAGLRILKEGGNAFDAAVAVTAALAVVEPQSSGLGGGGFYLLHRARDARDVFLDARETAPAAARRDLFLDAAGNVIRGASTSTPLASGIPGEVAAMAHLARHYGRLPLARSLAPAIALARDGFPMYTRLQGMLKFSETRLREFADARNNFYPDGQVPAIGVVIRQPQLANTLQRIAKRGADEFYRGDMARQLVAALRARGGIWSTEDLARYRVVERTPLRFEFAGNRIVTAPPPSAGGVALAGIFNTLAGYDWRRFDAMTLDHVLIEALRRAYRDRAEYLGDPDFVHIPIDRLTSRHYADTWRAGIQLDRATPSSALTSKPDHALESHETTHFSILDIEGNRVAATVTVNLGFGSGVMLDGFGFFLNNEMDDFSIKPGTANAFQLVGHDANAIAPGKRMLSSMTPTFVENDQSVLILGTPGGSRIVSMVLLGMVDWLQGADAAHLVARKRFHHQYLPDEVSFEPDTFTAEEQQQLRARGHTLKELTSTYGNMQVITVDKRTGEVRAASDPRGEFSGWMY